MKGKFITLVLTLGFLAAFGVFMHSPPSILDGLTGATPKAKRAAQMAAPLEATICSASTLRWNRFLMRISGMI